MGAQIAPPGRGGEEIPPIMYNAIKLDDKCEALKYSKEQRITQEIIDKFVYLKAAFNKRRQWQDVCG